MEPIRLELQDVAKSFRTVRGSVAALTGVDLTVHPGELFVLLGPSGCGKTTLLNLVAGLDRLTKGEIRFSGRVVSSVPGRIHVEPFDRDVSFVFQSYALYPHMTVHANLEFPLTNQKPKPTRTERNERVRETARRLGIEDLLGRKPRELSGGQRQRVAIGRAIVRSPRVFLMDEPLSNLDARLRVSTRSEIKRLQKRLGITTLYVTHDQTEAMTLGDRIALLSDGGIEQTGTPEEIYRAPVNAFVAGFIGPAPLNLLDGELVTEKDETFFVSPGFRWDIPGNMAADLRRHGVRSLRLGVRPEHLRLRPRGTGRERVRVDLVEKTGPGCLVHVIRDGGGSLLVETRALPAATVEGERLDLDWDDADLLFFTLEGRRVPTR